MSAPSLSALIDKLREADLLDNSQLSLAEEFAVRNPDPATLAQYLQTMNWLTPYQTGQLLDHGGRDLVVGPYILLDVLGEGGMGKVFKARPRGLDRAVALKVIRQQARDGEAVQRFQREARVAAQLAHPNIVLVRDFGLDGDTHFMAMEYLEGIDLATLVRRQGPLPIAHACEFIRQAALGLQHAHEYGMVHRDIKPSNLMATWPAPASSPPAAMQSPAPIPPPDPSADTAESAAWPTEPVAPVAEPPRTILVKILDMGLVRLVDASGPASPDSLTQNGAIVGTPDFIAPEQALNSRQVDIRADLYSLGCTLYFLLTGHAPFPDGAPLEKLLRHQLDEPQPVEVARPAVSAPVAGIVRKLLAKRPMDRYQTPGDVAEALAPLSVAVVDQPLGTADEEQELEEVTAPIPALDPATAVAASVYHWTDARAAGSPEFAVTGRRTKKIAVCTGHQSCVTTVAFAPHQETMASGDADGSVRLWEFSSKRPPARTTLRIHSRGVHALALSAESRKLATGSGAMDGALLLWDLSNKELSEVSGVTILPGHQGAVDALAFSSDGKLLASGGSDKTLRVWFVGGPEYRCRAVLKGHDGFIRALAFAENGQTIASCSTDGTVRLWSIGRLWSSERAVLHGHIGAVHAVAFSPDGNTLASAGQDRRVRLWDIRTAQGHATAVLEGHMNVVRSLQFSPDSETLVSAGDGRQVIEWHAATGELRNNWALTEPLIASFAITRDGRYVAAGTSKGPVVVYRLVQSKRS